MPDFLQYHQSITDELLAVKDRIRRLVRHWPTDGEWKEAALRTVLRRCLPSGVVVGRGFVVGRDDSSTQIDVLVLDQGKPALFRDGELAIVTPDVPRAIAEVKTRINGQWHEISATLAKHGEICRRIANNKPWLGLFAYDGEIGQAENALAALAQAYSQTGVPINCVALGCDLFIRYWPIGEREPGDAEGDVNRAYWRAYSLDRLSPSYFISNLIDSVCNVDRNETDYVWFAYREGKRPRMVAETPLPG